MRRSLAPPLVLLSLLALCILPTLAFAFPATPSEVGDAFDEDSSDVETADSAVDFEALLDGLAWVDANEHVFTVVSLDPEADSLDLVGDVDLRSLDDRLTSTVNLQPSDDIAIGGHLIDDGRRSYAIRQATWEPDNWGNPATSPSNAFSWMTASFSYLDAFKSSSGPAAYTPSLDHDPACGVLLDVDSGVLIVQRE